MSKERTTFVRSLYSFSIYYYYYFYGGILRRYRASQSDVCFVRGTFFRFGDSMRKANQAIGTPATVPRGARDYNE